MRDTRGRVDMGLFKRLGESAQKAAAKAAEQAAAEQAEEAAPAEEAAE